MSCKHGKIGNKTRVWICDEPGAETLAWDEILGAVGFTPPDQGRNTVDQPMLNQKNDGTHRAPGSRNFGDITLNTLNLTDANAGLVAAAAALETGDCVAICVWPGGKADLAMVMMAGIVTQCAEQEYGTDANQSYALTIACNDLYEADDGQGPES